MLVRVAGRFVLKGSPRGLACVANLTRKAANGSVCDAGYPCVCDPNVSLLIGTFCYYKG